jgi:hypothetical protein
MSIEVAAERLADSLMFLTVFLAGALACACLTV